MGNVGESLINVVMLEMPKLLIGIDQKVGWTVALLLNQSTSSHMSTGEKANPEPVV